MPTSRGQGCDGCGTSLCRPLQCGRCLSVNYCGRECQRAHWSQRHSSECKKLLGKALREMLDGFGGMMELAKWLLIATRILLDEDESHPLPPGRPTPDALVRFTALAKAAKLPLTTCLPALTVHALEVAGRDAKGRGSREMREGVLKELKAVVAAAVAEMGVGNGLVMPAHLAIGRLLVSLGRTEEALRYAEEVLDKLATAPSVSMSDVTKFFDVVSNWSFRGELRETGTMSGGSLQAAERFLRKAIAYGKRTPGFPGEQRKGLLLMLTMTLSARKANFEAVKVGRQLLADPELTMADELLALFAIAESLSNSSCHEEAIKAARRALQLYEPLPAYLVADKVGGFHLIIAEGLAYLGDQAGAMDALGDGMKVLIENMGRPGVTVEEVKTLRSVLLRIASVATVVLEMQGLLDQAIKLDDHLLHVLTGGRDEKDVCYLPACAKRRRAQVYMCEDRLDEAEEILRDLLQQYKEAYDRHQVFSLPDPDLKALWGCNVILAQVLDERGTESAQEEARLLRADVEESQAIETALQDAMLHETREEARRVLRMQRGQPRQQEGEEGRGQLVSVGGGGGGGKGRKARKRRAKKGRRAAAGGGGAAAPTTEEREADDLPALGAEDGEVEADSAVQQQEEEVVEKKGEADREDEEEEDGDECAICCLAMVEGGEGEGGGLCVLKCSHRFHRLCMSLWVDRCRSRSFCPTCPYCRVEVHHSIE